MKSQKRFTKKANVGGASEKGQLLFVYNSSVIKDVIYYYALVKSLFMYVCTYVGRYNQQQNFLIVKIKNTYLLFQCLSAVSVRQIYLDIFLSIT